MKTMITGYSRAVAFFAAAAVTLMLIAACSSEPELGAPKTPAAAPAQAQPAAAPTSAPAPAAKPELMQWDSPPAMTIDTSKDYRAVIELEKGGEIVIDLFEDGAPTTVNNFVFLAREGFYDGCNIPSRARRLYGADRRPDRHGRRRSRLSLQQRSQP